MLADVLPYLVCPHCRSGLTLAGSAVRCARGHAFDVARQGYVNLVPSGVSGDTAVMVGARAAFLEAGHYAPIVRAIVRAADGIDLADGCVVDLGAGVGHYLAAVVDARPERIGLALDVSPPALRRAAHAHPRVGAVGCDVWQRLPVADAAAGLVLNAFAPRNPAGIHRILDTRGALIVVSPTTRHLAGLVAALGLLTVEPDKLDHLDRTLSPLLELSDRDDCEFVMSLPHKDVEALVRMGPSAWHIAEDSVRHHIGTLPEPVEVAASVTVSTYRVQREHTGHVRGRRRRGPR